MKCNYSSMPKLTEVKASISNDYIPHKIMVIILSHVDKTGIILCMHPANERWCYSVTPSLIGWVHTQNDAWKKWPRSVDFPTQRWHHIWCGQFSHGVLSSGVPTDFQCLIPWNSAQVLSCVSQDDLPEVIPAPGHPSCVRSCIKVMCSIRVTGPNSEMRATVTTCTT